MGDAISGLMSSSLLDSVIQNMAVRHVLIAEMLAGFFLVIALVWNVLAHFIKSKGRELINYAETSRILVMMFIIPFYIPLMYVPIKVVNLLDEATAPSVSELVDYGEKTKITLKNGGITAQLSQESSSIPEVIEDVTDENNRAEVNGELDLWDFLGGALNINMLGTFLLDLITVAIGGIIKIVVLAMLKILSMLFYVVGPFAWAFSVLPLWKDKMAVWFNTFVTILFAKIVYNIFDKVLYANLFKDVVEGGVLGQFGTGHQSLVINLVMLVLYFMPFWVAGKVVGSSDAGRFLSLTAQIATTAISSAASGALGGGSLAKIAGVGGGGKDKITNS